MEPELKDLVRQHRRLSGLTMIELAKLAGVGKTVVFDIEHGKETVQLDTLKKVLAVLNLKLVFQSPVLDRTAKARGASPARP